MISRRRFLTTSAAALATACASRGTSLQQLQIAPGASLNPAPWLGLNVITYDAISTVVMQHLQAIGRLTLRCPVRTIGELSAIAGSLTPYPELRLIALVETIDDPLVSYIADIHASLPMLHGVALGNELDLANVSARDAHDFAAWGYDTLRASGYTGDIYAPSLYCVQPDHLHDYAFPLWQNLPDDVIFDIHRYGDPDSGQAGYASRDDENATIRGMIGTARRLVVSEVGWPTRTAADVQWVLAAAQRDRDWCRRLGAIGWCYYQLQDGSGTGDIDHYGLRRVDGSWKGLDALLAGN